MRTHIDWTLRPPPGTRFALWMTEEKQDVRLEYNGGLLIVPDLPNSRHYIMHADMHIIAELQYAESLLEQIQEWVDNILPANSHEVDIVAWLDTWIQTYLRHEFLRVVQLRKDEAKEILSLENPEDDDPIQMSEKEVN